jgi:hypothetical protein
LLTAGHDRCRFSRLGNAIVVAEWLDLGKGRC